MFLALLGPTAATKGITGVCWLCLLVTLLYHEGSWLIFREMLSHTYCDFGERLHGCPWTTSASTTAAIPLQPLCHSWACLASMPAGLSEGGWHLIPSCAVPCHTGFYVLGKTESAAEAAFTLPGGLVVPSVEIITFQAVGAMQAARQNCMSKNSKWDAAASQMWEHSQVPRWLPVCLHGAGSWSPCRARHPQSLSLPCQPSAHGWEALQRYMDSMLCLKTSFVLPKVACPQSHRAAELFAHSSWSKIQDWLSLLLGEAKETVKVGTAEGWAVRWISLGWPVTELCMATLCLSWGISLPAFFVFLPNEIRDFKSIKGIQSTKNIPGGICGLRTNLNKCICMERIVITASCTHLCSDCKKPQLLFCNVFQKFQTKETENSVQKNPKKQ